LPLRILDEHHRPRFDLELLASFISSRKRIFPWKPCALPYFLAL
jgi:hypothetical protein